MWLVYILGWPLVINEEKKINIFDFSPPYFVHYYKKVL